jgi:ATP-binding cassette subfamily B protein
MKNILRIIRISKPLHSLVYLVILLSFISGIIHQVAPILSKQIVDEIQKEFVNSSGNVDKLITLIVISFVFTMLSTAVSSILQRLGDHFGGELRKFLIEKFYDHILRLPQSYFDTEISGKIVNQLNRGISSIENFMKTASNFIFPDLLNVIITLSLMFYYSWPVAVFTIIIFPIYTWLSYHSSKKWGEKDILKNKHEDNSRGRIQEIVSSMRLVKGFGNQKNEFEYISNEQAQVNRIYAEQSKTFHLFDFARNTSLNIVLVGMSSVIFYNAFQGVYSFGTVVLLMQLIAQIRMPLYAMSFILSQIQSTESGTKEFFEILDLPAVESYEVESKLKLDKVKSIKFEDVLFSYEKGEGVLNKVNFEIKENEKVALIGHSGAGKSTVINLIMKFYEPTGGEILVNDNKYSELSHNDVRGNIALVFQDNELISTTVRENVTYGMDATDEEVIEAMKKANAYGFVSKFKDGMYTQIGERGIRLSGGQKQRIQIARAILANKPIVILDEATSNLDAKSEHEVQEAMAELVKDRIVIIIAHRFSTIQNVDTILVLDEGKVADSGTPKELSKREGIYKTLLEYQIEGDKKLLENFDLY